jgi:hypothetical protein
VLKDHPSAKPPDGGWQNQSQFQWAMSGEIYWPVVDLQVASVLFISISAYLISFLITGSPWKSLLVAMFCAMFPAPINYARWLVPETPSASLHMISLVLIGFSVFCKNVWVRIALAVVAGAIIGFNVMLRLNFIITIPVFWIACTLITVFFLASTRRKHQPWLPMILIAILPSIPFFLIIRHAQNEKEKYSGAKSLSDGFARMGCILAARHYAEIPSDELPAEIEAVRKHMLTLDPPPADPRHSWPAIMFYMNRNAYKMGISPAEFRDRLATLNRKVIIRRPFFWFKTYVIPAWREEMIQSRVEGDGFRIEPLRDSWSGRLHLAGERIRSLLAQIMDPTIMLVIASLFLLAINRKDWRRCFLVLILVGTHLGSMSVASLLGISAEGRYRFTTEAGAMIVYVIAFLQATELLLKWVGRVIQSELLSSDVSTQDTAPHQIPPKPSQP